MVTVLAWHNKDQSLLPMPNNAGAYEKKMQMSPARRPSAFSARSRKDRLANGVCWCWLPHFPPPQKSAVLDSWILVNEYSSPAHHLSPRRFRSTLDHSPSQRLIAVLLAMPETRHYVICNRHQAGLAW